jgi:hypothetical protein
MGPCPWSGRGTLGDHCDPELAHVGPGEDEARTQHGGDVRMLRVELSANDRARTERAAQGSIRLVVHRNGRVPGVSILAAHACELTHAWNTGCGDGAVGGEVPYESASPSARSIGPSSSTSTLRPVSSFIRRAMILCSSIGSTSSLGAGNSTKTGSLSVRPYTPSSTRQCR